MYLKHVSVVGVVIMAAIFASVAAPLQAQTPSYGGIGATVANFNAANPNSVGKPPAGVTYYRVGSTQSGRVSQYHVVIGCMSKRNGPGLRRD